VKDSCAGLSQVDDNLFGGCSGGAPALAKAYDGTRAEPQKWKSSNSKVSSLVCRNPQIVSFPNSNFLILLFQYYCYIRAVASVTFCLESQRSLFSRGRKLYLECLWSCNCSGTASYASEQSAAATLWNRCHAAHTRHRCKGMAYAKIRFQSTCLPSPADM
jgi:hypothetical protein